MRPPLTLSALAILTGLAGSASAHPLGSLSIDHYSHLRPTSHGVRLRYILDMAELPALAEMARLDTDHDGRASTAETTAYIEQTRDELVRHLVATVNGTPLSWAIDSSSAVVRPTLDDATTFSLRIVLDLRASISDEADQWLLEYRDGNYPERAGWKEIVVEAATDLRVLGASAPLTDRSEQLTRYPPEVLVPPQEVTATLELAPTLAAGASYGLLSGLWMVAAVATVSLLIHWRRRHA